MVDSQDVPTIEQQEERGLQDNPGKNTYRFISFHLYLIEAIIAVLQNDHCYLGYQDDVENNLAPCQHLTLGRE